MTRSRVLLTAFTAYGTWRENASELALRTLLEDPPRGIDLDTRLYPVDFDELARRLPGDLRAGYDRVLHLGQAPGRARIEFEAVGRNQRSEEDAGEGITGPLLAGGPESLCSDLPFEGWVERLHAAGIPAAVSQDAGSYLCNAALYRSLWVCRDQALATRCGFVHVPLTPAQAAELPETPPSLASEAVAKGLALILEP